MNSSIEKPKSSKSPPPCCNAPTTPSSAQRPQTKSGPAIGNSRRQNRTRETPYHALVRELREELGIEVQTAYPWVTRVFTYPHATVRLNFFRVTEWSGELHPHEGQEFAWQLNPPQPPFDKGGSKCGVSPLLPANAPILRALELPALYAISNVQELGEEEFMRRLEAALRKGLRLVQLREKNYSREALRELALKCCR